MTHSYFFELNEFQSPLGVWFAIWGQLDWTPSGDQEASRECGCFVPRNSPEDYAIRVEGMIAYGDNDEERPMAAPEVEAWMAKNRAALLTAVIDDQRAEDEARWEEARFA